jgi:hypothetical protein
MPFEHLSPRVALVMIAQTTYDYWEPLSQVSEAVKHLREALLGKGYESQLPTLVAGGDRRDVEAALADWLRSLSARDRLLLYWTGHGTGKYLVTKDSPAEGGLAGRAVDARQLGAMIAESKAEKVLAILDTCYSSGAAFKMATDMLESLNTRTPVGGQVPFFAIIPSSHALKPATEAAFCRALVRVLSDPDATREWSDNDAAISVSALRDALFSEMKAHFGPDWLPAAPITAGYQDRFLPNPRYRGPQASIDVESRRKLLQMPQALELAARGVEVGEAGFYFSGRSRVLADLGTWLREGAGLVVVTGPPGVGKSAVLGRLVMLCEPAARGVSASIDRVSTESHPPTGAIDAVVHAKGLTTTEFARALAVGVAIDARPDVFLDPDAFLQLVKREQRRLTVVVDALDEAAEAVGIGTMLRRLCSESTTRALVGSRRSPDGRPLRANEDRHGRLRGVLGEKIRIIDLQDEADTDQDIARYVAARLRDSPHKEDPERLATVSRAVAERARGVFIYARVVSRMLQNSERLDITLPDGPLEAFRQDLAVRFRDRRASVEALLLGLAWAEGAGLSRRTWPVVATATSPGELICTDDDVSWTLDHAGSYILEGAEAGQTVYRLIHQSFADYYRSQSMDRAAVQRRIAEALSREKSGTDWLNADPYVWRHLADHVRGAHA